MSIVVEREGFTAKKILRLAVCDALDADHSVAKISREIRVKCYPNQSFDGVGKNDRIFEQIRGTLNRIKAHHMRGNLDTMRNATGKKKMNLMQSNYVQSGDFGRGRKLINKTQCLERKLMDILGRLWKVDKRVTRAIIFRQALDIDKRFLGGVGSPNHFSKLKQWFYHGLNKRFSLSIRKISSVGQKLPRDWETKLQQIIDRVKRDQSLVTDDFYVNTDQVPVWIESVGNYTWGKACTGRRFVRTAGKEKDRFTVQLCIAKSGRKLKVYIIFKGKFCPVRIRLLFIVFK